MINFKTVSAEIMLRAAAMIFLSGLAVGGVSAESVDCSLCHPDLAKKKVIHAAVQMGCAVCHSFLDAGDIPHKVTGKIAKGLLAEPPELCFGCHDKNEFMSKKSIHPPVIAGMCTSCHSPHSSDIAKLLIAEPPDLCFTCHDKTMFTAETIHLPVSLGLCLTCHAQHQSDNDKLLVSGAPELCFTCHDKAMFSRENVHAPVAAGMCLSCHGPHAAAEMALLTKRPTAVCLECHPDIPKKPHVVAELRHPVGSVAKQEEKGIAKKPDPKAKGPLMDPARPEKEFYCGSCHDPHSSDFKRLMRYKASAPFELCINCHKK